MAYLSWMQLVKEEGRFLPAALLIYPTERFGAEFSGNAELIA